MNNQKNTLTATVGFVLTKVTKIHEAKTLEDAKGDAEDISCAMQHLIKEFDLDESKVLTDAILAATICEIGNIMAGYYVRRDEDELAKAALPDSERKEMR
ncbi:hypothetical protein [Lactobacillus hominis]|uniref:Uncharacterized protein n=1 Tax=Lactobacillus hominis DSM 23910 = CRBIP 24.179 TaxID=1423758 RepID=I7IVZ5_9LACO|nr:hypothetical protein [Lactobacillus hominis]KRM84401.1 hypothetical protein FC41_GL000800 [Lactobacillus hominis DSM 23910 = CRBIP 24.179]MCT3347711.1 hypothetical protein [Lactobacillus hominis]CCI82303.1 Protein of unknown function [Lactobacillus hominis DSM 23910 = CRBIP 24.179]